MDVMSDTPITDAATTDGWSGNAEATDPDVARELERKCAMLQARADNSLVSLLAKAAATERYVTIYKPMGLGGNQKWRVRVGDTNYFADSVDDLASTLEMAIRDDDSKP